MAYILDSSSFKYLLDEFPKNLLLSIWEKFEFLCNSDKIISDREVKKELEIELNNIKSIEWLDKNKSIFKPLTTKECDTLAKFMDKDVFSEYENDNLLKRKLPQAIPFIISKAKANSYTLVYRERTPNANSIIDICLKNDIKYLEVTEFLEEISKQ